jgi:hypothetical protein
MLDGLSDQPAGWRARADEEILWEERHRAIDGDPGSGDGQ